MHEIQQFLSLYADYSNKEEQSHIIRSLTEPIDYIIGLPGKKIRPLLCLLGYARHNQLIEDALPAAHALELFHNFTLMHDDMMDAADLRRGQPTVHLKFNTSQAILSGDAMMILAYQYLFKATNKAQTHRIGTLFSKVAMDICIGQQMDMDFENERSVTTDEYLEMVRLKTAVLLGASLQIGSLLGGGTEEEAKLLYEYGVTLGVAFQIQDDYMDLYGSTDQVGKVNGGDILRNKKTHLVCSYLQNATTAQQSTLHQLLDATSTDPEEKIAAVKDLFAIVGHKEKIQSEIKTRFDLAQTILDSIPDPSNNNQTLALLAEEIKHRRK